MGRLTWSTGLTCRRLPRLQPAAAARAVALGPEEINVGCWRTLPGSAAPHFSPRRRSRRDEGAGGQPRAASRPVDVLLPRPARRSGGGAENKILPRGRRTSRRCPHPRWQFALCFLCVLPVRWRPLANSPQVAATQQRGPPPRSFPLLNAQQPESCVAEAPPS